MNWSWVPAAGAEPCPEPAGLGLGGCFEEEPGAGMPPDQKSAEAPPACFDGPTNLLPLGHVLRRGGAAPAAPERTVGAAASRRAAHSPLGAPANGRTQPFLPAHSPATHGAAGAGDAVGGACRSAGAHGPAKRPLDSRGEAAPKRARPDDNERAAVSAKRGAGKRGSGVAVAVAEEGLGCEPAEFEPHGVDTAHAGATRWGDECDEQPRGFDLCHREVAQPGWSFDVDDVSASAPMGPGSSFDGAGVWDAAGGGCSSPRVGLRASVKRQAALSLQEFDLLEQLGGMNIRVGELHACRGDLGSGKRQKVA